MGQLFGHLSLFKLTRVQRCGLAFKNGRATLRLSTTAGYFATVSQMSTGTLSGIIPTLSGWYMVELFQLSDSTSCGSFLRKQSGFIRGFFAATVWSTLDGLAWLSRSGVTGAFTLSPLYIPAL